MSEETECKRLAEVLAGIKSRNTEKSAAIASSNGTGFGRAMPSAAFDFDTR
jgi:hypothetical protein